MKDSKIRCSFCNRSKDEVQILIAGADGHICENCVSNAREIIEQELFHQKAARRRPLRTLCRKWPSRWKSRNSWMST
ncbi:hypothetical protein MKQ70_31390 [Chitinophaga sedimenti]|uniref:ClpX C4-type zinc finger protein n=1 Tax=Chitinophaga sedimenti TaxID=2033606 RepID=UPI002006433A|nr:ClpX C4-type zinc finger protein [Chitinophaga sedimenti]MCK7559231.1 hypothetical protein [Chitinophaga sedimenti]